MANDVKYILAFLTRWAVVANIPVLAAVLMLGRIDWAVSLCSGTAIGLASYALLFLSIRKATALVLQDLAVSKARVRQGRSSLATLFTLKIFGMAAILLFLLGSGKINLICFLTGFLLTQGAVSIAMLRVDRRNEAY